MKHKNKNNITLSKRFQIPIAKIVERDKLDTPYTQTHMITHSPGLVHALQ